MRTGHWWPDSSSGPETPVQHFVSSRGRRRAGHGTTGTVTGRRLLAETLKGQESQSHLCRWKDNLWLKSSRGRIETPARAGAGKWWLLVRKRMFLLTSVWLESWDLEAGMGTAGEAPKVIAPDSGDRASASGRKSKVWWRLSVKKISALGHIFWSNWALNLWYCQYFFWGSSGIQATTGCCLSLWVLWHHQWINGDPKWIKGRYMNLEWWVKRNCWCFPQICCSRGSSQRGLWILWINTWLCGGQGSVFHRNGKFLMTRKELRLQLF